jgi:2-iminobutanoate/2-iminopropanoate deaminase
LKIINNLLCKSIASSVTNPEQYHSKMQSHREITSTPNAPAAIGPFSQATKANGVVYVSGCLGLDPATKTLVPGGVGAQARRALENLKNVIEASGSNLSKVMKCTVLLTDMANFAEINGIYAEYFPSQPPARTTFAVAGLPLGGLFEVDAIALE